MPPSVPPAAAPAAPPSPPAELAARVRALPADRAACASAALLVAPVGFALAAESASDNAYMDLARRVDPARARAQHAALAAALGEVLPVVVFDGAADAPDAHFPNNVFASVPGALVIGRMRHPVRQREAEHAALRGWFAARGGVERDLRAQPGTCELTGSMVVDRARGVGFCGLGERCDAAGAEAMRRAFDLRWLHPFALAPGEYHANVVMSVLASRALVIAPDGFADPRDAAAIAACYAPRVIELSAAERAGFAGNCLALTPDAAWMSEAAADALAPHSRAAFERAGFAIRSVALDEIEKSGGSLRCCVAEVFDA